MPDETASSFASASPPLAQDRSTKDGSTDAVEPVLLRQGASHDPERIAQELLRGESQVSGLSMQLDVTVPIPEFRIEDLLTLEKGTVVEARWPHTDSVPVWCGGAQLVWAEFEVRGQKLAVRVTRLR